MVKCAILHTVSMTRGRSYHIWPVDDLIKYLSVYMPLQNCFLKYIIIKIITATLDIKDKILIDIFAHYFCD